MRSSIIGLSLVFSLFWAKYSCASDPAAATVWLNDFSQAQAEAERLQRPLVVHFHTKWCQPCRLMEREVLNTPAVLRLLEDGFVAVKVDLEKPAHGKLQSRYGIDAMPTDLVLSQDGKVLSRTSGYKAGEGNRKYIAALNQIHAQSVAQGKAQQREAVDQPAGIAGTTRHTPGTNSGTSGGRLVPDPVEPQRTDDVAIRSNDPPAVERPLERPIPVVAIDGYCPVTLRMTRTWKAGQKEFVLEHDGQIFYFTTAAKRDEFKANPARYAPRLMGCDPVTLTESDLAIRGSTKFGAFYDGDLFLFESDATRTKFRKAPTRYTRVKHALKPEDIKDVRSLASATVVK